MGKTLYEKIYSNHLIYEQEESGTVIYIDRHLLHEVTSPQAFSGLRETGRKVRMPHKTFATMDHNVSTKVKDLAGAGELAKLQLETLIQNCKDFNVHLFHINDINQGVVHVIGPEQGITLPGSTIVCGDSHTATHGAFGALAFGIGTSEVEHVLATQTLKQDRAKTFKINITGTPQKYVSAKDIVLAIIGQVGHAGGTGYIVEFTGETVKKFSMEARMTLCNMAIELGAKAALIAPDEKTFAYLKDRNYSPKGKDWEDAVNFWKTLYSDADASFDRTLDFTVDTLTPQVTWGINPGQVMGIEETVPKLTDFKDAVEKASAKKALEYMGLTGGEKLESIKLDTIFIGSCTNGRIEDLRIAAEIVKGKKVVAGIEALVVPGSGLVKEQAEREGLDKIFIEAGFQWRLPGCSMCLAMNDDKLAPFKRSASTSNRNFEGRQGRNSRTHLVSPEMAAAAAIMGHFVDVRNWK